MLIPSRIPGFWKLLNYKSHSLLNKKEEKKKPQEKVWNALSMWIFSCLIECSSQKCTINRHVFRQTVSVYFLHLEHLASNNEGNFIFPELHHGLGGNLSPKMILQRHQCQLLHLFLMKGIYFSEKKRYQEDQVEQQQEEIPRNLKLWFFCICYSFQKIY